MVNPGVRLDPEGGDPEVGEPEGGDPERRDLERLAIGELRLEDLEREARARNGNQALPLREWVAVAEAWRIALALREARGNRTAAARALGIGRRTLYSKLEKLGLTPVWVIPGNGRSNAA